MYYFFQGKKFKDWAKNDVNDYTNLYLKRDGHRRCDDPFTNDKFAALYERLEKTEDDKITHFSKLF